MKKLLELLLNLFSGKSVTNKEFPLEEKKTIQPDKQPSLPVNDLEEPAVSDPNGSIATFLWKPESDTNPKVSVITVGSDTLRASDVRVQIKDKNGKLISGNEVYNVGGVLRGNKLPGYKYGRFNFKPGKKADEYSKLAPLKVFFFLELNGKRSQIKVMGKNFVIVKNPKERLDLK